MRTQDHLTVATPEDVEVTLPLAGIGSRAVAAIIDLFVMVVLAWIVLFVLSIIGGAVGGNEIGAAIIISGSLVGVFVILFGYNLVTELWFRGRSPGKRAVGIHVEREDGLPLDMSASARRNFLRIVDFLPLFYAVGLVSIIITGRRKRLGDLVAGTVVLKDDKPAPGTGFLLLTPRPTADWAAWDVSGVTEDDLLLIRRYLQRRQTLSPHARADLTRRIAERMRPRTLGVQQQDPELFLEGLVLAKAQQAFLRHVQLTGQWLWAPQMMPGTPTMQPGMVPMPGTMAPPAMAPMPSMAGAAQPGASPWWPPQQPAPPPGPPPNPYNRTGMG